MAGHTDLAGAEGGENGWPRDDGYRDVSQGSELAPGNRSVNGTMQTSKNYLHSERTLAG